MKKNYYLLGSVLLLSILGLMMVYSSSSVWAMYRFHDSFHYVKYQGIFFIVGLLLLFLFSRIPYSIYHKYSFYLLGISFLLLVLVLIPGIGSIRNGSRSWFGIGSLGIQPSELCKIALLIFTSKYLAKNNNYYNSHPILIFLPVIGVILMFFGLIMLQPDLGTGTIIVLSCIAVLFIGGMDMRFFIIGGVIGFIGLVLLIVVAPYRLLRIISFIDPWKDALGSGFQMIQSLYAIGPGGLLGHGYLNSIQKHFYLPEPQTDFIFSVLAEEFGIVGVIVVVGLFFNVFYQGMKISLQSKDLFGKYLSFGLSFQILFQAILNLMVVVGLIPVTGVTLPFLSYGGSSLLVSMVSIGIILNISKNNS